jgi:hypothetical protein
MSYMFHWVVVYDEDLGVFMVDAETTMMNMAEHPGLIYSKTSGRWEDLEEGSELEAEYNRLEEVLAYQLIVDVGKT